MTPLSDVKFVSTKNCSNKSFLQQIQQNRLK